VASVRGAPAGAGAGAVGTGAGGYARGAGGYHPYARNTERY